MLCTHSELLSLLALSECAQSFPQQGTGSSDRSGETAACIHVPLFHKPWLTCCFNSTEHDILRKLTEIQPLVCFIGSFCSSNCWYKIALEVGTQDLCCHSKQQTLLDTPPQTHSLLLHHQGRSVHSPDHWWLLPLSPHHIIERLSRSLNHCLLSSWSLFPDVKLRMYFL